MKSMKKKELVRRIIKEFPDAVLERSSGKHMKWKYWDEIIIVPKTPSDCRAWLNIRGDFRRVKRKKESLI